MNFRIACGMSVALSAFAGWGEGNAPWAGDLWLGRGGEWTTRAEVCVSNGTSRAWKAETVAVPVGAAQLPLAGVRTDEIRVVDAAGAQLEYGVYDAQMKPVLSGPIPSGGSLALPVTAAAGAVARFHVYWGNPRAWGQADRWKPAPSAKPGRVTVGPVERRLLSERGANASWPAAGDWEYRVPVRFRNPSDRPLVFAMGSADAAEALRATRNPAFRLEFEGRSAPCVRIGAQLFFFLPLPAKSIDVAYLYVKTGTTSAQGAAMRENVAGSEIPSDQISRESYQLDAATLKAFADFMGRGMNLLRNPIFDDGLAGWSGGGRRKGVEVRIANGGIFGTQHAVLSITDEAPRGNWAGLVQTIDVKPNCDYGFGAFLKGTDVTAKATVHLHLLDADGRDPVGVDGKRQMLATCVAQNLTGTFGWTPLFGRVHIPPHIRKMSVHLTMNGTGELHHDGALVAECGSVGVCDPESAPRAKGDFAVCAVSPIVKVFPEFRVKESKTPFALALARNETEDLQLAVESGSDAEVSFEIEPPKDGKGRTLRVAPGVVTCVPVDYPSSYYSRTTDEEFLRTPNHAPSCDGWTGLWPDPVERLTSFHLAANETKAVRLAVSTAADTPPGIYTGAVRWSVGGKAVRRDAFTVKVWDFTLPARPSFAAIYDIRLNSKAWRAPGEKTADGARARVLDLMAEYKICPDSVKADPVFKRDAEGHVTADFASYDRAAHEHFDVRKFPASYMPTVFYCFGWGHPPRAVLGEAPYEGKYPFTDADRSRLRPAYVKTYQEMLRLYWEHVKAKGWSDRLVLYISDEPYFREARIRDQMIACCKMIHEVDPKIRIYCSTWRHCPEWDAALDVWGVGSYGCFPTNEMTRLSGEGKGIWFTTDGQQCLDTPWCAIERMQPMYAWAYGAEAYEFWGCTWLTYDPWRYGWHAFIRQTGTPEKGASWVRYPNGDGYHIYPPRAGAADLSPVPSVRLCAIRDGVEEFTYLERLDAIAADAGCAPALRDEARRLRADYRALLAIPNAGGRYSSSILPEPEVLDRLRLRAGELIARGARARQP